MRHGVEMWNKLEGLANITKYCPKKYIQYVNICDTIMIEALSCNLQSIIMHKPLEHHLAKP